MMLSFSITLIIFVLKSVVGSGMDYSDTTVMIPVKDEPAVETVAKKVLKKLPGCKVLVIYKGYDGSLKLGIRDRRLAVIKQEGSGKGVAVVQAAGKIHTNIMCLIDGDETYEVEDLKKMIELVRGGADMAIGNRLYNIDKDAMPAFIQAGNKIITIVADALYGMRLKDSQTGIRAIRKSAFDSIEFRERHFGIETEMDVKFHKKKFKVVEIPTKYYKRVGESKQMKLIDGIKLLLLDFKFLFGE
jgi:glycosyltransferase involved in cell wall biosynthesis